MDTIGKDHLDKIGRRVFLHSYQQDHVQMTANPTGFVLVSVQPTVVAHLARSRKQEDVV